jgi:hypothetical protein
MTDLEQAVRRMEDPIDVLAEEVVRSYANRRISILLGVLMGHLPGPLPEWARSDFQAGARLRLKRWLKRLGYVYRDGRYLRFADLPIREAWAYIHHLEENHARDRARIKYMKSVVRRAEQVAGDPTSDDPIGDLLGWSDQERAA